MPPTTFDALLQLTGPAIERKVTPFCDPISAHDRLGITVRNEGTHAHLARGHYLLPYDFVAFDHQPPRPEIMALQDVLDGVAVDTATAEHRREAELLHWLISVGHSRATLQAPVGLCSDDVFAVTAGLMSELQTTSSVGSGGKRVLGSRAFGILSRLTCSDVRRSSTLEIRSYRTTSTPLGVKISTTQLEPWLMKPSSDSTEVGLNSYEPRQATEQGATWPALSQAQSNNV
ncbi:hypothetical protein IscW_ISCW004761 [Ixodes scapularis]|uniref:Uncharacterized protein n=1 Tax=Ixodes scapularis TaxID=6945 RepID=B7PG73_IXOSC|nr:hypothetical protein IscW_ISCW004761 [Ixodes scapularis]|eukprot:XP_002434195.1 hypothetical protein IscW_ISCW004761 [Ixodes scapularis]